MRFKYKVGDKITYNPRKRRAGGNWVNGGIYTITRKYTGRATPTYLLDGVTNFLVFESDIDYVSGPFCKEHIMKHEF
jgi:hypothetical protein